MNPELPKRPGSPLHPLAAVRALTGPAEKLAAWCDAWVTSAEESDDTWGVEGYFLTSALRRLTEEGGDDNFAIFTAAKTGRGARTTKSSLPPHPGAP